MKKGIIFLALISFITISNAYARTARLSIKTSGPLSNRVVITGKVSGYSCHEAFKRGPLGKQSGLWLGITAIVGSKKIDFEPIRVNGSIRKSKMLDPQRISNETGGYAKKVRWVVSLWVLKVHKRACAKKCSYCRKNGYHMENRITSSRSN